jgi:histidinol dehydrogenase
MKGLEEMVRIIRTDSNDFEGFFQRIMNREGVADKAILKKVSSIVQDVARRGDEALFEYTKKFDKETLDRQSVAVSDREMDEAMEAADSEILSVIELTAKRIEKFHRSQVLKGWSVEDEEGIILGQKVSPLERVGIYAPGGLAAYPSTVLMTAIPARIAGVKEIILTSPGKNGRMHPLVVAAAQMAGVDRMFKIGGAQAIAALAYGTKSIPKVDKIVGPGNAYVAAAKKLVFGEVAIDMIAGPSEVVIIADGGGEASYAAADLIAQAEHDPMASAVLMTPDEAFGKRVAAEVDMQIGQLPRMEIARRSLSECGAIVITKDMVEAAELANRFAPEHLELMIEEPRALLDRIHNAGAVFLGYYTPEAVGDYVAGPNHVLPTGGTARFSSPLGVYDFMKRTSVISFTREALNKLGNQAALFARVEGLDGHSNSIRLRCDGKKS